MRAGERERVCVYERGRESVCVYESGREGGERVMWRVQALE